MEEQEQKETGLYNTKGDTLAPLNCAGEHIPTWSVNCKDEKRPLLLELASYFLLLVEGNCLAAPFNLLPLLSNFRRIFFFLL